jgi:hypothetical protein
MAKLINYDGNGIEILPPNHGHTEKEPWGASIWADKENIRHHGLEYWRSLRVDPNVNYVLVDMKFRQYFASESWTTKLEAATTYAPGQATKTIKHIHRGGERPYFDMASIRAMTLTEARAQKQQWEALDKAHATIAAHGAPKKVEAPKMPLFELPDIQIADLMMDPELTGANQELLGATNDMMTTYNMMMDAHRRFMVAKESFGRVFAQKVLKLGVLLPDA